MTKAFARPENEVSADCSRARSLRGRGAKRPATGGSRPKPPGQTLAPDSPMGHAVRSRRRRSSARRTGGGRGSSRAHARCVTTASTCTRSPSTRPTTSTTSAGRKVIFDSPSSAGRGGGGVTHAPKTAPRAGRSHFPIESKGPTRERPPTVSHRSDASDVQRPAHGGLCVREDLTRTRDVPWGVGLVTAGAPAGVPTAAPSPSVRGRGAPCSRCRCLAPRRRGASSG